MQLIYCYCVPNAHVSSKAVYTRLPHQSVACDTLMMNNYIVTVTDQAR